MAVWSPCVDMSPRLEESNSNSIYLQFWRMISRHFFISILNTIHIHNLTNVWSIQTNLDWKERLKIIPCAVNTQY